ncbi:hypothetical protein Q1695_002875 [Nippostrongylus brasiliensis]|nr:hypothetical protein Q1695_002875 [Nippostrongylus brasiliensis]
MYAVLLTASLLFVTNSAMPLEEDLKRTIDVHDMMTNVTRLEGRLQGNPIAVVITELLSRLQQIPPSDVEMLADAHRAEDNELVDDVLTANNIVNTMLAATDEELRLRPPNLAALILASNDIAEYIRTHFEKLRFDDRQF